MPRHTFSKTFFYVHTFKRNILHRWYVDLDANITPLEQTSSASYPSAVYVLFFVCSPSRVREGTLRFPSPHLFFLLNSEGWMTQPAVLRRPRMAKAFARLLICLMVFAVFFFSWRLHNIVVAHGLKNAKNENAVAMGGSGSEVHLKELRLHAKAPEGWSSHTVGERRPNRTLHGSLERSPLTGEAFDNIMIRTVQNTLFEDESLWGGLPEAHPRLAVACDLGNASRNSRCASFFRQAFRKQRSFAVIPLQRGDRRSSSHWLVSPPDVTLRIPSQCELMKSNTLQRLRALHQHPLNTTALIRNISLTSQLRRSECLRQVTSLKQLIGSRNLHGARLPSARILSAHHLAFVGATPELPASATLQVVFHSASLVVFALDDVGLDPAAGDGPSPLLDAIAAEFERPEVSRACFFASAHDLEDAVERPVAVLVRCNDTDAAAPSCPTDDDASALHGNTSLATRGLATLCADSSVPLHLSAALKWGTKTAIFRGTYDDRKVAVKMFHVEQYRTFGGFLRMMEHSVRSPYINYPSSSCFDPTHEAVFQLQPLLSKGKNLLQHMKAEGKTMSWPHRLELCLQLLCAFHHLHEHPAGFVTFDDNHPEQYYITSEQSTDGRHLRLTMVDIDTLQIAEQQSSADAAAVRDPRAYKIQCRCFFCHGRSDCLFLNSLRGYRACGQGPEDPSHGDREDLSRVHAGKQCDGHNDMWFLAQLFYLIGKGSVAWSQVPHAEVVSRLQAGTVPTLTTDEPAFNKLVDDMFHLRVGVTDALAVVDRLCATRVGCRREGEAEGAVCQSDWSAAANPYSSPLIQQVNP